MIKTYLVVTLTDTDGIPKVETKTADEIRAMRTWYDENLEEVTIDGTVVKHSDQRIDLTKL